MRITVIPEQLRQVAQAFREAQSGWEEIGRQLRAQQGALDWEVCCQQAIEEQIGQAVRMAQALAQGAAERYSWLEAAAARFEAADREAYQPPALSFLRASIPPIPQILGVWTAAASARAFPTARLIPGIVPSLGGLGVFALISMLLQYWHRRDEKIGTLSAQEILDRNVDQGTFNATGMSATETHDEIQALGYSTIEDHVNADFEALRKDVEQGPVVAIVKLGIRRTGTNHAVVVSGISEDGKLVKVNDPWDGQIHTYTREDFEASWGADFGGVRNSYMVIRPILIWSFVPEGGPYGAYHCRT